MDINDLRTELKLSMEQNRLPRKVYTHSNFYNESLEIVDEFCDTFGVFVELIESPATNGVKIEY